MYRKFKLWNSKFNQSFDLSEGSIKVSDVSGLGNKYQNITSQNHVIKSFLNKKNSFLDIKLKLHFGIKSNAYSDYKSLLDFISDNSESNLSLEYDFNDRKLYVDVLIKDAPKSQKDEHGTIVEDFIFERISPFYTLETYENISSVVIENNYSDEMLPIIEVIGPTVENTVIVSSNIKKNDNYILGVQSIAQSNGLLVRTDAATGLSYQIIDDGDYTYAVSQLDHLYPFSEIKDVVDEQGNVFVRIPKFYAYRTATELKISKYKQNENWFDPFDGDDYIDIGKYKGVENNSKIESLSGILPRTSINITDFRTKCRLNGVGYGQSDIWSDWIITSLIYIMFATTNTQSIFQGRVSFDSKIETGNTDYIKYKNGMDKATGQHKIFGIEDLWGHVWEFIDGVNFLEEQILICRDPDKYDSINITADYEYFGDRPMTNGYVTEMTFNPAYPNFQFPKTLGGSSSIYYADYYYQETGQRIAFKGGNWSNGLNAGLSYWFSDYSASNTNSNIGGRLLRRPS
jgi:hypothetical protein